MANLKIAVSLSALGMPLKKALQTAARLGASGVEIDARSILKPSELSDTGRRQLKKLMEDLNLKVAAIRFPTRRGYNVLADLDRRIDATKQAMRFAYSLGASVVINAAGIVPESTEDPQYALLQASLSDLARYGQHVGAMLACETGSEPTLHLTGLLESLTERAIGVAFNPGNLIVNNHFDEQSVKECSDWTLAVIARDGVRDLARGRGISVPLGQGSAEIPEIIGVLEEQRFAGWYHLDPTSSSTAEREIADGISYLKEL